MPSPNFPSPPEANIQPTIKGVNAPPHRALNHKIPCALTRSITGNQFVKALAILGKQPASPTPNRNRQTTSDIKFQAQPVATVKIDHIPTTRMSTRRGPMRSPSQPPGISNSAYAQPKAVNAYPICILLNPSSACIAGAA